MFSRCSAKRLCALGGKVVFSKLFTTEDTEFTEEVIKEIKFSWLYAAWVKKLWLKPFPTYNSFVGAGFSREMLKKVLGAREVTR